MRLSDAEERFFMYNSYKILALARIDSWYTRQNRLMVHLPESAHGTLARIDPWYTCHNRHQNRAYKYSKSEPKVHQNRAKKWTKSAPKGTQNCTKTAPKRDPKVHKRYNSYKILALARIDSWYARQNRLMVHLPESARGTLARIDPWYTCQNRHQKGPKIAHFCFLFSICVFYFHFRFMFSHQKVNQKCTKRWIKSAPKGEPKVHQKGSKLHQNCS